MTEPDQSGVAAVVFYDRRGQVLTPDARAIVKPRRGVFALVVAVHHDAIMLSAEACAPDTPELPGGGIESGETPDAAIERDEVFGPVLSVMPFEDEADALRIANGTRFGLAASVWTNDVARAHRVASKLTFGMVWINDHHRLDPASPWGGFKDSGVGRETGTESFDAFTEPRAVTVNTTGVTADWYGDTTPTRLN